MRVLIFVLLAIAAVSGEQTAWCTPYSTYWACKNHVYNGGLCYCNNDGSAANCRTTYEGSSFAYTQTSGNRRGNLGMCLADGTCFNVPLKKDLTNVDCVPESEPALCAAQQHGRSFIFIGGSGDDHVEGPVTINGTMYQILPVVANGQLAGCTL